MDLKTLAIVAPSSRGEPDAAGIKVLEDRGINIRVHEQCFMAHNQSAGTSIQRAAALSEVMTDDKNDAVMATRGGNRAMHLLPLLNFTHFKKPFIGFSDATALSNAIYAKTGRVAFHGPSLSRIAKGQPHEIDQMIACLSGRASRVDLKDAQILKGGKAAGKMIGGNLSVFASLCGTPYMPHAAGAILFLEDIGDQLSRYDRMLAQLRLNGILDQVAGIMFGVMATDGDSSVTPFGFSLEQIISEHTAHLDIPVVMNAPFGHSGPLPTFPVGGAATLDVDSKTLSIEQAR